LSAPRTTTYSGSDSPSLAPGVGGRTPWYDSLLATSFCTFDLADEGWNSVLSGLVGASLGGENVSPKGWRGRGLDRPDRPPGAFAAAAFNRSSVAFNRASRASSSEVWEETAFFLEDVSW